MKRPNRVALWDAIHAYTGHGKTYGATAKQGAVVAIEKAVDDEVETLLRRVAPLLLAMNARQRGVGGQTITDYECAVCGEEKAHGNTACPVVCPDCARRLRELLKPSDDVVLHLKTQRNQPYGSVRVCCERCGVALYATAGERWTNEPDVWENPPKGFRRCS